MENKVKVLLRTMEVNDERINGDVVSTIKDDFTKIGGKAAGVCYMPDDYFSNGIQNDESAIKRAHGNAKNGHHSVFGHCKITFEVKTSKMMAMVLNSIGVYDTSEKSARYTKMQPKTEREQEMYDKWRVIIQKEILKRYPTMDDDMLSTRMCKKLGIENTPGTIRNGSFSHIKEDDYMEEILKELKTSETLPSYKLAQENARYMISVFTPTVLMYTISDRNLSLLIEHLKALKELDSYEKSNFSKMLADEAYDLAEAFEEVVGTDRLVFDNKGEKIRFLSWQNDMISNPELLKKTTIADSYTLSYKGSLAMLAQAQRHRTLRYEMVLSEAGDYGYYVPKIVQKAGLTDEWLKDIESVSYCVPQGTIVNITEQGIVEDFVLKCKERMCGRAQLEIMESTRNALELFSKSKENLCKLNQDAIDRCTDDFGAALPRCAFKDFKCTEGCYWHAAGALIRNV